MNRYRELPYNLLFVLAILSTGFLVSNMLGTLIYRQQIFFEQEGISGVEMVILIKSKQVLRTFPT